MSDAEEETLNEIIKIVNKPRWFSPLESITAVGKRHTSDPLKCVINVIGGDYECIDSYRHSYTCINVMLSVPREFEIYNSFRSLTHHRGHHAYFIDQLEYTDSLIVCIGCRHSWMSQLEADIRKKFPSRFTAYCLCNLFNNNPCKMSDNLFC